MPKSLVIAALLLTTVSASPQQQPTPAPAPAARITGRVLTIGTNVPIAGATVAARRADTSGQPSPTVPRDSASAKTDDQGAFALEGLDPGVYVINATAGGYFPADATPTRRDGFGRILTLASMQQLANVDFRLGKAGVLVGTVLDDKGEPVPRVRVSIMQPMMAAGARRLMPLGTGSPTDDRGRFQFADLAPGDYFLVAMGTPFGVDNGAMLKPIEGTSRPGFSPTYFPSTTAAGLAEPIAILPGSNIDDIRIALWTSPMFDVHGRVVDDANVPATAGSVQLLQLQDEDVRVIIPANAPIAKDGSFVFAKVPTGTYVLQARTQTGFGALPIQVIDNRPVEHRVTALAARTIKGKFVFEGPAPASTAGFRLNVQPTDFVRGPVGGMRAPSVVVKDDWTFELPGVQHAGVIRGSGPAGWFVKRASVGGRDVTDIPTDYRERDVDGVEVVFSSRWASIEVQVVDAKDAPVLGATVLIFPEDRQKLTYPSRFVTIGAGDQRGVFRASALPAERYLVAAVPAGRVMAGNEAEPAFLESIRPRATPVSLSDLQKTSVKVTLINPK